VSLTLITPPAVEPVSLEEAKLHLRVDSDDEDDLIASLIAAARQAAETITGRQLISAQWQLVIDAFPSPGFAGIGSLGVIQINKCPVQVVRSLCYLDLAGAWQTMSPSDYSVDVWREPARIGLVFGKTWPTAQAQIASVKVVFDAGYGQPADVPEGIKNWIKLRIGSLYTHREEMAILNKGRIDALPFVDRLLDPYRVATI
jgi:uncharacterized phiE125 gp8 family phage protein